MSRTIAFFRPLRGHPDPFRPDHGHAATKQPSNSAGPFRASARPGESTNGNGRRDGGLFYRYAFRRDLFGDYHLVVVGTVVPILLGAYLDVLCLTIIRWFFVRPAYE